DAETEDVPVDHGEPPDAPVRQVPAEDRVDAREVRRDQADQYVGVGAVPRGDPKLLPELGEEGDERVRLPAPRLPRVQRLERPAASAATLSHRTRRPQRAPARSSSPAPPAPRPTPCSPPSSPPARSPARWCPSSAPRRRRGDRSP